MRVFPRGRWWRCSRGALYLPLFVNTLPVWSLLLVLEEIGTVLRATSPVIACLVFVRSGPTFKYARKNASPVFRV